jgi:phosphatidylinositol alpha-1,6-mannosyltransferase
LTKILYLTPGCFDKGGISRYNRYQVTALRELVGEENVRVLSLLGPQKGDFEEDFKVYWNGWGAGKTSKAAFIAKTLAQVYGWKPDVIWLGHVNLTEILVRFKLLKKATSVLNVYGLEVWSGLRPKVEVGFKSVDHVISDCHFTANYVENENIRAKGSIAVIWDCVDLEKFQHQPMDAFYERYDLPSPAERPWILSLGRLSHTAAHKGYDRLLKVFHKVAEQDANAVLVFAGKGDMIPDLKQQAAELGIAERVYFSGMVHENDMAKFYTAATIFSLVSDRGVGRGEGIPLTPLEAMACGTPIIVGNHDGSQEAIIDEQNGNCIDPFDFEKHSKVILELLENDSLRETKEKAAVEIAHQHFSYGGFKEKHLEFLIKIGIND